MMSAYVYGRWVAVPIGDRRRAFAERFPLPFAPARTAVAVLGAFRVEFENLIFRAANAHNLMRYSDGPA